jgi:hypothetical protein
LADGSDERSLKIDLVQNNKIERLMNMKFAERVKEKGAMGYILLWLLGIPIPILLIIFLVRGCT